MKSREYYLTEINKQCRLYFNEGDICDGIALENINKIIEAYKKDR